MVFFDLDGTLIDSNGAWVEVDRQFLAKRGLPHSPDYQEVVIHSIFPIAAQYTKDHFGLSESVEEIMGEWLDMAREIYAHQAPLKPGAKEYLEHLSRRGERMALVTSCIRSFVFWPLTTMESVPILRRLPTVRKWES